MDKLDKLSLLAIVILVVSASFLVVVYADDKQSQDQLAVRQQVRVYNPELDKKVSVAKDLLENNNLLKAEELAKVLINEYPYDGAPHMVVGDIELRKQDSVAAMEAYRNAIDLNPDFLDKKTKVFQGKKIKATVLEAKNIIEKDLAVNPGNQDLKDKRKTVYYMLRRIAGSCG
jgi:tetratricopeptide (TPR) repeat protein